MQSYSTSWTLRSKRLDLSQGPLLMGILNVTPDSFSDGGQHYTIQSAVDHALRMEDDGADILDIGGESTRPYSQTVGRDEELRRVVPVLEQLQSRVQIPISIDTMKASVARAAMDLGAEIINDVSGLNADPEMLEVALKTEAGICAMHMQGTPQTMQDNPQYDDVVEDILGYLLDRKELLLKSGIAYERICLDPGIGFGKTHEHNIELIQNASRFHETGAPILIGHSRKGFIAKILGSKDTPRVLGTIGVSLSLALQRIQILRIHDVAEHKQALKLFLATKPLH